jgi:RNA polymerase sigma-70 factor (ECF subfamily)
MSNQLVRFVKPDTRNFQEINKEERMSKNSTMIRAKGGIPSSKRATTDDCGVSRWDWDYEALVRHVTKQAMLRLHVPSRDMEDVIQATVVEVYQRFDKQPENCSFTLWVKGIARNCARAYWRNHQRELEDEYIEDMPATTADPVQALVQGEFRVMLAESFRNLTSLEQEQLRQHFEMEMTFAEIAEMSGEKASAVSNRYYRALEKLRRSSDD